MNQVKTLQWYNITSDGLLLTYLISIPIQFSCKGVNFVEIELPIR